VAAKDIIFTYDYYTRTNLSTYKINIFGPVKLALICLLSLLKKGQTMSKTIVKLIGLRIAEKRKERKITQEELAELVKVSTETVSRLERGVSIPSLKTLEKVSRALNIPLNRFFDFEDTSKEIDVFSHELSKLITFLKTKKEEDIKLSYQMLRLIFNQLEKRIGN